MALADKAAHIRSFIQELEADGHDWPRKVRLITFDAFRDLLGPTWSKVGPKVELLAEKLIRDQMSECDRCLAIGEAEFLVFYAGATAQEIRIRCFAIAEAIQEKLFGVTDQTMKDDVQFAEVHRPTDDLVTVWERADQAKQLTFDLRGLFHRDPEILDVASIAASAQVAIDSIITSGLETGRDEQIDVLQERLDRLSEGMTFLNKPSLIGDNKDALARANLRSLQEAQDDAAQLRLTVHRGRSSSNLLEALAKLRKARAERAAGKNPSGLLARPHSSVNPEGTFQYLPVLRSVSRGDQIYQGMFRIVFQPIVREENSAGLDIRILDHALRFWETEKPLSHFLLMVRVHAETLRNPILYQQYSSLVRTATLQAKRFIVLEVVAGDDAAESIAMRRAIQELRAHFLSVFVVLTYQRAYMIEHAITEFKKAGIHALGVEFSQAPDSSAPSVLRRISSTCHQNALSGYASDICNFTVFAEAISAGIGYTSAPVVRPALGMPVVGRTNFESLYSVASQIGRTGARQVLLAEDEALFRDAVAEFLRAGGFEVLEASDGLRALAMLKKHPHISLLISDVRMPRMDGYSLVEASLGLKPDLKVIMMTGYAYSPSKFVKDHHIYTMHKPFDLKALASRVQNLGAPARTIMLD